jgi:hypothetical protein
MDLTANSGITQLLQYLHAQHLQSLHSPQLADFKITELFGDSVDDSTLKSLPLGVPPYFSGVTHDSLTHLLNEATRVASENNSTATVLQVVRQSHQLTAADVAALDCYVVVVRTPLYTAIGILPYLEIDKYIKPYRFLDTIAATVHGCTTEMIVSKVGSLLAQHHPREHHALVN